MYKTKSNSEKRGGSFLLISCNKSIAMKVNLFNSQLTSSTSSLPKHTNNSHLKCHQPFNILVYNDYD